MHTVSVLVSWGVMCMLKGGICMLRGDSATTVITWEGRAESGGFSGMHHRWRCGRLRLPLWRESR